MSARWSIAEEAMYAVQNIAWHHDIPIPSYGYGEFKYTGRDAIQCAKLTFVAWLKPRMRETHWLRLLELVSGGQQLVVVGNGRNANS